MHQWKKTNKPCFTAFTPYTPIGPQGNQDTRSHGWLTEQILFGSHMGEDVRAIVNTTFKEFNKKDEKWKVDFAKRPIGDEYPAEILWCPSVQHGFSSPPYPSFSGLLDYNYTFFFYKESNALSIFYTEQYTDFTVKNADVTYHTRKYSKYHHNSPIYHLSKIKQIKKF